MIIFRQTEQSASGILACPFDRARRVEFQGSARLFDQVVSTTMYSPSTRAIHDESTHTTALAQNNRPSADSEFFRFIIVRITLDIALS